MFERWSVVLAFALLVFHALSAASPPPLNVSTAWNLAALSVDPLALSSLNAAVSASVSSLNATAATAQQLVLLSQLAVSTGVAALSAPSVTAAASLLAAIVSAQAPSAASVALGLSQCALVASSSSISVPAYLNLTTALSLLAAASGNVSLAPVAAALSTAQGSLASSLASSSPAALTSVSFASNGLASLVVLTPPGMAQPGNYSAGGASFTGSPTNLPTQTSFVAAFLSLFPASPFPEQASAGIASVATLAFYVLAPPAFAPALFPAQSLTSPIFATLPSSIAPSFSAQGVFWNTSTQQYSTSGVFALPNPSPPNSTLFWPQNFTAASGAALSTGWALGGAAYSGCSAVFLDCSVDADRGTVVPLCASSSLAVLRCGGATAGAVRAWAGCGCPLLPPASSDAAASSPAACFWSASSQRFAGPGCVTSNATRIATNHLTSFAARSLPPPGTLSVLSASDLVASALRCAAPVRHTCLSLEDCSPRLTRLARLALAVNGGDLARIQNILVVLSCLFAGMHLFAFGAAALDSRDCRRAAEILRSPACGCALSPGATRVWRFDQAPLVGGGEDPSRAAVGGSLLVFASLAGIPFARLAAAVPEPLLGGQPLAHCVGSLSGLSPTAHASRDDADPAEEAHRGPYALYKPYAPDAPQGFAVVSHAAGTREISLRGAACGEAEAGGVGGALPPPPPPLPPALHFFVDARAVASTAFAHALDSALSVSSVVGLARERAAFTRLLRDAGCDATEYARLFAIAKAMLLPRVLRRRAGWFSRARCARLALLQAPDGSFDGGDTPNGDALAVALLASNHVPLEVKADEVSAARKARDALASIFGGGGDGDAADGCAAAVMAAAARARRRAGGAAEEDDGCGGGHYDGYGAAADAAESPPSPPPATQLAATSVHAFAPPQPAAAVPDAPSPPVDCPLTFSASAIAASMPAPLLAAFGGDSPAALRCWATLLSCECLCSLRSSWLVRDAPPATAADGAAAWLAAAFGARGVGAGEAAGFAREAAGTLRRWAAAHSLRCDASRAAHLASRAHGGVCARRGACMLLAAARTAHPSFKLATCVFDIGFQRNAGVFGAWRRRAGRSAAQRGCAAPCVFSTCHPLTRPFKRAVLFTTTAAMLVVAVWLDYNRSNACCASLRTSLGCAADPRAPCLGSHPSCSDLVAAGVSSPAYAVASTTASTCGGAFPNGSGLDTFLAGLLAFAVVRIARDALLDIASCSVFWLLRSRLITSTPSFLFLPRLSPSPPSSAPPSRCPPRRMRRHCAA